MRHIAAPPAAEVSVPHLLFRCLAKPNVEPTFSPLRVRSFCGLDSVERRGQMVAANVIVSATAACQPCNEVARREREAFAGGAVLIEEAEVQLISLLRYAGYPDHGVFSATGMTESGQIYQATWSAWVVGRRVQRKYLASPLVPGPLRYSDASSPWIKERGWPAEEHSHFDQAERRELRLNLTLDELLQRFGLDKPVGLAPLKEPLFAPQCTPRRWWSSPLVVVAGGLPLAAWQRARANGFRREALDELAASVLGAAAAAAIRRRDAELGQSRG